MANRKIYVHPRYPEPLTKLFTLSMNIWSYWNEEVQNLFRVANSKLFDECGRNPLRFLNDLPEDRRAELATDPGYLEQLEEVYERFCEHTLPVEEESIAYFSMEFGLHLLPIYAGGLGMLAGDIFKGASDLAMPIVGVGLYYRYGYFRQNINIDGEQEEFYNEAELPYLPMRQCKDKDGNSLYVYMTIKDTHVKIRVWEVSVGKLRLLLLDTNVPENPPEIRAITDYLYVADREQRMLQEIVLGRGGYLTLEAAGISPQVYHLNEGHSAFLIIERLKTLVTACGYTFEEARNRIKATTVFTTHTPVEAGNEQFSAELIRNYLKKDVETTGIHFDTFIKEGFLHDEKTFWMPALALRYSSYANGVSKIHAGVSRSIWKNIYMHKKEEEIPIVPITNGAHCSWMAPDLRSFIRNHTGQDIFTADPSEGLRDAIAELPDAELWDIHMRHKRRMVSSLRAIAIETGLAKGFSSGTVQRTRAKLNTGVLTVVFARRFAPYKRPTLILNDKERLALLLKDEERPIQLVVAGKAHPADPAGKKMIKDIIDFTREFDVDDRVFFIEDYNRDIAELLVQGADVWLNTPIKPNEASGTSGMKAGMNGVLNMSVLDGWWPECYNGANGWAITAGDLYSNAEMRDRAESTQIYSLLEGEIADLYYDRNDSEVPHQWVAAMKESIYTVATGFSIYRTMNEYNDNFYAPALQTNESLLADDARLLKELTAKASRLSAGWQSIKIEKFDTEIDSVDTILSGDKLKFSCTVAYEGFDPSDITAEIVARDREGIHTIEMPRAGSDNPALFSGKASFAVSGPVEIDLRIVPSDKLLRHLYPHLVLWA